jgi:hypothetical protein
MEHVFGQVVVETIPSDDKMQLPVEIPLYLGNVPIGITLMRASEGYGIAVPLSFPERRKVVEQYLRINI